MDRNLTLLTEEYGRDVAKALLPNTVLHSIINAMGIIGNLFMIFMYTLTMKKEQMESRYFIPWLAFYDLLVCITSEIYFLSDTYFWISFPSDVHCKVIISLVGLTMITSDSFLLTIAVQRYVKICRPRAKQMTLFWRRVAVGAVIITNIIYTAPTPIVAGINDIKLVYKGVNISGPSCFTGNQQYPLFQLIYYGILIVIVIGNIFVTAGLYTPIACVIYRHFNVRRRQRQHRNSTPQLEESTRVDSEETDNTDTKVGGGAGEKSPRSVSKRLSRTPKTNFNLMFFVIIFVYVVSYVPTAIMLIYVTLDDGFWTSISFAEFGFYNWLIRSYVINHAANPFIYAYFDLRLRDNITRLFCKRRLYSTS